MKYSLALTVCLAAATLAPAATRSGAAGIGPLDLLKDLHATAADAEVHGSNLMSISRGANPSWQTAARQLEALKSDLNQMAPIVERLEHFRGVAAPSEQKAIDEAIRLLRAMARNTQAAMQFVGKNQGDLWMPEYQTYVGNVAQASDRLAGSLGQFIKLAKVRGQEERLERTLGVEAGR